MNYTVSELQNILNEAQAVAYDAAKKFYDEKMGGFDGGACGFAWVNIYGVKGNTKLGRMLKAAGVERSDYKRCFTIWNPSGLPVQNIDCKEAGAIAAAKVLEQHGFKAYAGSRLD